MGQDTEAVTTPADIEATRANLSRDIDELTDKVSPGRVVERRKQAVRGRFDTVKDKIMGSASSAKGSVSSTGSNLTGTASDAAGSVAQGASGALDTLESKAEGNPLAAGLVAFGAGMLISALIPVSDKEAQAANRVVETAKEHAGPVVEQAKSVGQEMGQDLKESAADAAQQVKSTAQDSVENVKQEGQSSAQNVKDDATSS
jgi:gas vesicle protein